MTLRPAAGRVAEQRWCDLSGEVPPLHRPFPPSPLRQQQPSVLSSHCRPSEPPTQTTRPPLHSWKEPPSPTTPSGDGGDRWRKEGETGALNREQGGARRKGSLQRVEEHKEEGVQRTVGAAAGGGLHSCPMCLLEFTVGSTQMERDGHLARCLSEVNVDMGHFEAVVICSGITDCLGFTNNVQPTLG
ncbi:Fanconi anemia core complex-associated protein 20-like [Pseudochaenichthys georgianus]|uniref:Fanconi anemia core complex-associated protein 20-like n=1 Tax=Pseudochaenichthys georgianus TaxID=52239 RepID=UPI0039C46A50